MSDMKAHIHISMLSNKATTLAFGVKIDFVDLLMCEGHPILVDMIETSVRRALEVDFSTRAAVYEIEVEVRERSYKNLVHDQICHDTLDSRKIFIFESCDDIEKHARNETSSSTAEALR